MLNATGSPSSFKYQYWKRPSRVAGLGLSFFQLENWAPGRRKRLALIKVKDSLDATLRLGLRFSDHQTTVYRAFPFSWWMGIRVVVNVRLRWTPVEQQLWRGKKEEPVSHLLREGPACPRAQPHKLPGWESPYRPSTGQQLPMNDAKWEGLYPGQVCVGCFFFFFKHSPSSPPNKITDTMQVWFYTYSFRLSKPHHDFRWPNEKNKTKLHLWPLRLKAELKWGCPAHRRTGHTCWYNWPSMSNVELVLSRLRDPWEQFLPPRTAKR